MKGEEYFHSIDSTVNTHYTMKIILLGNPSVGKTSIIAHYIKNEFYANVEPTIGIDWENKIVKIDEVDVKLQIWDTAGQEMHSSLSKSFFINAVGIIIVFDLTERSSFNDLVYWINFISQSRKNVAVAVVGNKSDLSQFRTVKSKKAKKLANKNHMKYFECSAKSGMGINELFYEIAKEIKTKADKGELVCTVAGSFLSKSTVIKKTIHPSNNCKC